MPDNRTTLELEDKKAFWEAVYLRNYLEQRGWYEEVPKSSLDLIDRSAISKTDPIIDIGAGDSLLVDHLLSHGFKNITVLDISQNAIENAKRRLGPKADRVKWIRTDILDFEPQITYALWHDRACLHFLNEVSDIELYRQKVKKSLSLNGTMIIGAFSESGPSKCSGLAIQQYNGKKLSELFKDEFTIEEKFEIPHHTPSMAVQNYVFCRFKREKLIT